jgi:hypothetical protein
MQRVAADDDVVAVHENRGDLPKLPQQLFQLANLGLAMPAGVPGVRLDGRDRKKSRFT